MYYFYFNESENENDSLMKKYCDPDMLYHYTSLNAALEKILPSKSLRFSSFVKVNDPCERNKRSIHFKCNSISGVSNNELMNPDFLNIMNDIRLNRSKLLCFSKNKDNAYDFIADKNEPGNIYRTGFFKPRMWAQYGDNHRGVCLALNKKKLIESLNSKYHKSRLYRGDIRYTDSTSGIRRSCIFEVTDENKDGIINDFENFFINQHLVKNREEFFFTKTTDWKDELEYRFLLVADDKSDYFVDIENCIEGIFLGIDFPKVYLHAVKAILPKHIDINQLILNDSFPFIDRV